MSARLLSFEELNAADESPGSKQCHAVEDGVRCTDDRRVYKRTCLAHRAVFGRDMLEASIAFRQERLRGEASTADVVKFLCRWCGKYISGNPGATTVKYGICSSCTQDHYLRGGEQKA